MADYAQGRADRRAAYDADRQMRAYLGTLTPQARAEYLAARQEVLNAPEEADRPPPRRQQPAFQQPEGDHMYGFGPFASAVGGYTDQQGSNLQGMANMTMGAIGAENERRVALSREMRRMEYEQWKVQQQLALEQQKMYLAKYKMRQDSAAEIRRLKFMDMQQNPYAPRTRRMQRDPVTGQYRWFEDWEL